MMTNNLNVPHKVTLTEGQISTILYVMEGYLQGSDDNEDTQFNKDCDNIFQTLEGTIDAYYNRQSEAQSNNEISEIAPETSYATPENKDYTLTHKVIQKVSDSEKYDPYGIDDYSVYNKELTHDSEGCQL